MARPSPARKFKWLIGSALVLVLILVTLIPLPRLNAPDWDVYVTDQAGKPVAGALVRRESQNYSFEMVGSEDDARSDSSGHVFFRHRSLRASFAGGAPAFLSEIEGGVHGSFGPHAYVMAFADGDRADDVRGGYEYDWRGSPAHVESHLVFTGRNRVTL